jgi:hypothetical protein
MMPRKVNNPPLIFSNMFLHSLFSAIGKEAERWEIVREDIGCAGVTVNLIAPWCNNQGGKVSHPKILISECEPFFPEET